MIDQDLLTAVQYALIEPPTGGLSWASDLWATDEIYGYLHQRQQRLLKSTHLIVGVTEIATVAGTFAYELPEDWLATVSAAWEGFAADTITPTPIRELLPCDQFQADLGQANWQVVQDRPIAYTDVLTGTRSIQLIPTPSSRGTLHLIYVPIATRPIGQGEPLQVPDTHCLPVLKYAVLADALAKVGQGADPQRANYCEWRVRLGEQVTQLLLSGRG